MTFFHVAVCHKIHTCPSDPQLHVWDTTRMVIGVIDGGNCQAPTKISTGDTVTMVACSRTMPAEKQCRACQTTIVESQVTTIETGAIK